MFSSPTLQLRDLSIQPSSDTWWSKPQMAQQVGFGKFFGRKDPQFEPDMSCRAKQHPVP